MTGSSRMDTNKETEESNNVPNNVGNSESPDSIEVVIKRYKKKERLTKFYMKN